MPFRLLVLSDLHVDFPENRERVPRVAKALASADADVLIIAGDVSHKLDQVEWALRLFDAFRGPKLFVAGNHDVWVVRAPEGSPQDSWAKLEGLHEVCERTGFHDLEQANLHVGPFTFVGSMGWYDYSFANPALKVTADEYARKQWRDLTYMDAEYALWGRPDAEVAAWFTDAARRRLAQAAEPIVYVSHHAPLEELVLRRGHPGWDFFNAYMGSRDLEHVVRTRGVQRFVFGHTHRPVALLEAGRFVVNNPVGYPRQALTPKETPYVVT